MIQDIYPHRLYNQYRTDIAPQPSSPLLVFIGGRTMVKKGTAAFPTAQEIDLPLTYLFSVDDKAYFMPREELSDIPDGYELMEPRTFRSRTDVPDEDVFAVFTGKHLSDWYRDTRFCGRCGSKTSHSLTERAMVCPRCGYTAYPRIMPAVIVGVINGDSILITRYSRGYAHNALIAGFTEIGETAEQTVSREVMEEAGIKVKNIRYYKSQPWGIAGDLLLGFYCEADGSTDITMDKGELRYAEWVKREDIVLQPDSMSLTNEMMMMFRDGMI